MRVAGESRRVQDLQRELVEHVQYPRHRDPRLGPYGQCGDVGRHGHDKVWAALQQRGQGLVG